MIKFNLNGKELGNEDINILICRDSIKDETELKMFCNHDEVTFDETNADIDININVTSKSPLDIYEDETDIEVNLDTLSRLVYVLQREIKSIRMKYR